MSKLFLDCVLLCSTDLVRIDIQAGDVGSSKLDDFSCWPSNTAANIQHPHPRFDANVTCQKVFMSSHSLTKFLTVGKSTEVECLAPAIFIKIGRQVVIPI